jgi:hypothetical protein
MFGRVYPLSAKRVDVFDFSHVFSSPSRRSLARVAMRGGAEIQYRNVIHRQQFS